jgi:DNA-binding NtrC family response regulator
MMHRNPGPDGSQLAVLIGNSATIRAIRNDVEMLADSGASVLVTGPSGSGKDVVAQLLHQRSRRAARPFVALNCAAVAPELLESEMFGHEIGAFTGAVRARAGRFETADGGTLFLDEVGDMAGAMQAKLLRVLETRVVERLGGTASLAVDVRLVAATSVDLFAAVDRGNFRSDLLYRIDVVRIEMPGLADRPEDIAPLVAHFAVQMTSRSALPGVRFDDAALAALMDQPWPGNVRELRNLCDRAAALFPGETIDRERLARLLRPGPRNAPALPNAIAPPLHFPGGAILPFVGMPPSALPDPARLGGGGVDLKRILADLEHAYITAALAASGGAVAATARLLGLQRTTLIEKMRRLQIATGTA